MRLGKIYLTINSYRYTQTPVAYETMTTRIVHSNDGNGNGQCRGAAIDSSWTFVPGIN